MKIESSVRISGLARCVLLFLLAAGSLHATTRTVTNLSDSGPGSLRYTIAASIAGDTITFAAGVTGTIALNSGELLIARDLTIIGPGAANLKLQGPGFSRILRITTTTTSLSGLTLSGGNAAGGGAISNSASLTLRGCVLSTNTSSQSGGMTLSVNGNTNSRVFKVSAGTVLISDLGVTNGMVQGTNGSPGTIPGGPGGDGGAALGGGIYNQTTLTLSNCRISGNAARGGAGGAGGADSLNLQAGNGGSGGAGAGGAIYSIGSLTLIQCTINGNTAMGGAGGNGPSAVDYFYGDPANGGLGGNGIGGGVTSGSTLVVKNCTFAGNSAIGGAGGTGGNSQPDADGGAGGAGGNSSGGGDG